MKTRVIKVSRERNKKKKKNRRQKYGKELGTPGRGSIAGEPVIERTITGRVGP